MLGDKLPIILDRVKPNLIWPIVKVDFARMVPSMTLFPKQDSATNSRGKSGARRTQIHRYFTRNQVTPRAGTFTGKAML